MRSKLVLIVPALSPSKKPLLIAICFVLGWVANSMINGVFPFRVFIFTIPFDKSPYSTDGIPVMISTDSMFEEPILRRPTPFVSLISELFCRRTPSTVMAVPKEAFPISLLPLRRAIRSSELARF